MTLYERGPELYVVADALRAAERGYGRLVVVSGPVGIGKSALLDHLPAVAEEHGARVAHATCVPLEQDFAFGVVRQLLEPAFTAASDEVRDRWLAGPASSALLLFTDDLMRPSDDLDDPGSPDDDRQVGGVWQVVLDGLVRMLGTMSAEQPLLLLVDDLQWADTLSLRLLGHLVRRMVDLRVTVVATVGEGDPRANRASVRDVVRAATHTLWLGPLSAASVAHLVRDEFGEPGDEEFVLACHEAAAGNPMFLKAVLTGMRQSGYPPRSEVAGTARSLSPSHLLDRLSGRLSAQPTWIKRFAKAMVVLGHHGDAALITGLAELDPVGSAEAVRLLSRLGLVVGEDPPRFVHVVVREAVEQMMTAAEVDRLHRRAAVLLYDSGFSSEHVAAHLLAATGKCEPWAIEVLRASAETALNRGAPEVAARYLRRALLDSPPGTAGRALLLVELATVEVEFDTQAALRHMSQGVPFLESSRDRALALVRIPPALLATATQPMIDVLTQVAGELADPDRVPAADRELALCLEARLRFTRSRHAGHLVDAVDRLRRAGPELPLDSRGERELASVLLFAATVTGDFPASEALRLGRRLLDLEPASTRTAHAAVPLLITALLAAGPPEEVRGWLDLALDWATRMSSPSCQATIGAKYALVLARVGKPAEASVVAASALEAVSRDWSSPAAGPDASLALAAIEADDVLLAEQILDRCGGAEPRLSASWTVHLLRGWLSARAGDHAAALDHLMDCGRSLDLMGWTNPAVLPWRGWAAGLLHELGRQAEALELAEDELTRALVWGAPATVGRALRIKGMITEGQAGVDLLREAAAVLEDAGDALELTRVSAALERRSGGSSRKGRPVPVGVEPWFGAGRPTSTTLTKTERRVAGLAARGFTNQEIAQEFGVSSRAVEKHLTNSYRKLGVTGRSGLPAALGDDLLED
ncbi:regulatory protein, luxR family [Lentzea fradiae]|uniref:Regulatory protein, luxR family n=1 Tax=Lentzea fradiae TaxID=200378 RepID=A0A1G7UTV0_9PSEU|nr:LuxR family transcriptional regulator [Lentzea fradiae]SDG51035.1 regulatory protein, luxR family [Lentzea fradiae]